MLELEFTPSRPNFSVLTILKPVSGKHNLRECTRMRAWHRNSLQSEHACEVAHTPQGPLPGGSVGQKWVGCQCCWAQACHVASQVGCQPRNETARTWGTHVFSLGRWCQAAHRADGPPPSARENPSRQCLRWSVSLAVVAAHGVSFRFLFAFS